MLDKLRGVLIEHLSPLVRKVDLQKYTWNVFCMDAKSWVAFGSMCGVKIEYADARMNPLNCNAGKRTLYEYLGADVLKSFLHKTPAVIGSASDKYDNGKARAIYSTGIVDYTIMSYVLRPLERKFAELEHVEDGVGGYDEIAVLSRLDAVGAVWETILILTISILRRRRE